MNTLLTLPKPSRLRLQAGAIGLFLGALITPLFSQEAPPAPVQAYAQNQPMPAAQTLSPESLKELVAPIALYPDALIALILPASTVPSDVVLASRFVAANGDPDQIPNQSWDNSVQSLASYPDVVMWMDENLEWTSSLGQAFLVQPADVMNAIQQLRAQAQAAGNLVDTPQQVIVKENTFIRIVPAEPDYLYVPQYDPEIVYVQPYSQGYGPLVTFGIGFAVGSWLNYDFDWNRHIIYRGDWQPGWDYSHRRNGGNNHRRANVVNIDQNTAQPWQASSRSRQQLTRQQQNFQAHSNNLGAGKEALGVSTAPPNGPGRSVQQVPRPSRNTLGNPGTSRRNAGASSQRPPATSSQPAAQTPMLTTTPSDVADQAGKPPRNPNDAAVGNSGSKRGQQSGQNAAPSTPSTAQRPKNPSAAQIGGAPATTSSKKKTGTSPARSTSVPQTTKAPIVDQNGRPQSAATQPATGEKRSRHEDTSVGTQTARPANQAPQPSKTPSESNPSHKSSRSDRPGTPMVQPQTQAAVAAKNHQQQQPQVQSNQPQQPSQAPKMQTSRSSANKPDPQAQPQQQQQQQRESPKQQAPQQAPQQQAPGQQLPSEGKRQDQNAAPAPKQNSVPAAETQSTPATKKSDKKKKDENPR